MKEPSLNCTRLPMMYRASNPLFSADCAVVGVCKVLVLGRHFRTHCLFYLVWSVIFTLATGIVPFVSHNASLKMITSAQAPRFIKYKQTVNLLTSTVNMWVASHKFQLEALTDLLVWNLPPPGMWSGDGDSQHEEGQMKWINPRHPEIVCPFHCKRLTMLLMSLPTLSPNHLLLLSSLVAWNLSPLPPSVGLVCW